MTLQEFITKWDGKYADWDGAYKAQCVDICQYWSKEVGGKPFTGDYAYQMANQTQNGVYTWIVNTPEAVPQAGDVVIWGKEINGYAGHIGIATGKGTTDTFECFEQNDPVGTPCHLKTYTYDYVVGWLRPKALKPDVPVIPPSPDIKTESEKKAINDWDLTLRGLKDMKLLSSAAREDNSSKTVIKAITEALKQKDTEKQSDLRDMSQEYTQQKEQLVSKHKSELLEKDESYMRLIDEMKTTHAEEMAKVVANAVPPELDILRAKVRTLELEQSRYNMPLYRLVDSIYKKFPQLP